MPRLPDALPDLRAGLWQHYKGPLYLVLGYGHDANAEALFVQTDRTSEMADGGFRFDFENVGERAVVVYLGLTLDGAHTGPRLAVRTVDDWFAQVCGDPTCTGYGLGNCPAESNVPRFRYIGPTWEPEPPGTVTVHGAAMSGADMTKIVADGLASLEDRRDRR